MTTNAQRKKRANKRNATKARSEQVRNADHTADHTPGHRSGHGSGGDRRSSSETKPALRTTELVAYAATVLAIIMTALALDADTDGGRDPFGAEPALRYITYLTIGYLLSRGLAKSGSWRTRGSRLVRDHSHHDDHDDHDAEEHRTATSELVGHEDHESRDVLVVTEGDAVAPDAATADDHRTSAEPSASAGPSAPAPQAPSEPARP